jgi:hypothetical protein
MNLYMDLCETKEFVRQRAAVRQCERYERQCEAVYLKVYGSVRLFGSVRQCAAVCGRECALCF